VIFDPKKFQKIKEFATECSFLQKYFSQNGGNFSPPKNNNNK
jgi:hypothetical protein